MGSFAAVAKGTDEEPALITLRYDGPDATGPVLGFVGKAVTFDTGGISLKPGAAMSEMKFDMSGGAAVLEAVGAIARLRLPIHLIAVIGATENMPSGHASKPGDIVRAMNGTTIEINNTDAEGRLVLADCLAHAVALGAERIVDLATLTGAIIIGLGSTHAGMMSNDDDWAATVEAAATATGELVWRMPFHAEYAELIKGKYADLDNAPEGRKAGSITAARVPQALRRRDPLGRTSTSPGRRGTSGERMPRPGGPDLGFGCSSNWRPRNRRRPPCGGRVSLRRGPRCWRGSALPERVRVAGEGPRCRRGSALLERPRC